MTDASNPTPRPSHPGGCPCAVCEAERKLLDETIATLREAGEIA